MTDNTSSFRSTDNLKFRQDKNKQRRVCSFFLLFG